MKAFAAKYFLANRIDLFGCHYHIFLNRLTIFFHLCRVTIKIIIITTNYNFKNKNKINRLQKSYKILIFLFDINNS